MGISKRHHYIPQFIIKNFTGDDGKVALYNKINTQLETLRRSPKQCFFEWNRNTFKIGDNDSDFVEKVYQTSESLFAPIYKILTEKLEAIELKPYHLFHLIHFIAEIHWRVPNQDEDFLNFVNQLTPENSLFEIKNRSNGENASQEIFDRVVNEPAFIESYKMAVAWQNYIDIDKLKVKDWKLYFTPRGSNTPHLICDNPVITRTPSNNILHSELIFPLSQSKIIYHTKGKTINELPAEHRVKVDILLFIQAKKVVCGPDGNYLLMISQLAKTYNTKQRIDYLKEDVFSIFS